MNNKLFHIGIYGRMNVGKSSLLNRLIGQQTAIVSPQAGTTTDSVRRRFELAGVGPVVLVDTAGIDDEHSELGRLRVARTRDSLQEVEAAIFVLATAEADQVEQAFLDQIRTEDIPCLVLAERGAEVDRNEILERIREMAAAGSLARPLPPLFGSRTIGRGGCLWFVCPIDTGAPLGRLILPQVEALRAALDLHATVLVLQPEELPAILEQMEGARPDLVVTDSQVYKEVAALLPDGVELTSFSALLAEQKGDKEVYTNGLLGVDRLKSGDRVLIVENCSHQASCDDIGRVKLPRWIATHRGLEEGDLRFDFVSGRDPLPALEEYALVVQCGGCMTTRRVVQNRIRAAVRAGVPITNYGMLIRKIR